MTGSRIGELRQDRGEEHDRLRVAQPDDDPVAENPAEALRLRDGI